MFEKIKAIALGILGITAFATQDNKVVFSEEQRQKLTDQFGEDFIDKFKATLDKELADTTTQDQADALQKTLDAMKAENAKQLQAMEKKMNAELAERDKKIEALTKSPEADPELTEKEITETMSKFKINPKARHNMMADMLLSGKMGADIMAAGDTIDVDDLKTEFDTFISQTDKPISTKLTQKTESMKYMTTKVAITEWRASQAYITSVVQQFSHKWTPLGASTFTPITIPNRKHKINVPITPDEINDSWLSHLYDEGLTPQEMPITKWIIDYLILPKVEEDREMKLIANGVYTAFGTYPSTGDAGQTTGLSMDGFVTQLVKLYEDKANNNVNFIALGPITSANIVSKMETFVDSIDEIYQTKKMNIFSSVTKYKQYKRAYRDEFPTTKNDDKAISDTIDFSVQMLQPLPSMATFNHFFCTPQDNFIHLRYKNAGASKIWMQPSDYDVKVFAEWWEGVGFSFEEAIFAYIDALQVIDGYAKAESATALKIYMLEDAGVTGALEANLAAYKVAIAAEDGGIATLVALQAIIDAVNIAEAGN
jgi:hypothetical protein